VTPTPPVIPAQFPESFADRLRLVRALVEYEAHRATATGTPSRWEQKTYRAFLADPIPRTDLPGRCDTALCVAGWAIELSPEWRWLHEAPTHDGWDDDLVVPATCPDPDGNEVDAWEAGTDILGLTGDQANALFDAENSLQTVLAMIDLLLENPRAEYHALRAVRS